MSVAEGSVGVKVPVCWLVFVGSVCVGRVGVGVVVDCGTLTWVPNEGEKLETPKVDTSGEEDGSVLVLVGMVGTTEALVGEGPVGDLEIVVREGENETMVMFGVTWLQATVTPPAPVHVAAVLHSWMPLVLHHVQPYDLHVPHPWLEKAPQFGQEPARL